MRDLPLKAQVFVVLVCLAGVVSALLVKFVPTPRAEANPWELALFCILAGIAGGKRVQLTPKRGDAESGSMSLGFAITFAAMLRFGPAAGVVVGAIGCLSGCLFPVRQPLFQIVFNVCLSIIQGLLAGLVFLFLNQNSLTLSPMPTFFAVMGSAFTYFAINTGGVATAISLSAGQNIWQFWRENFLWTAPTYFAGGCISTLAMVVFGRQAAFILVFLAPVIVLIYLWYQNFTDRVAEQQAHMEEMEKSQRHLADLYLATIKSLALAIDAKDAYTHQHILRVQRYSVAAAKQMGLLPNELEGLNTGALLHDIGKLGVPEYVLLKPGRLTEEEYEKMKQHPGIGAAILDPVEFPWPVLPVVKYHHERWDGTGYPEGLAGEDIPLTARILAVADVYDALTSNRSYRNAWNHERALVYIRESSGKHFDAVVVNAFLEVIDGVVAEMALEGIGPLAPATQGNRGASSGSKADEAARAIQRTSTDLFALYEVAQMLSSSLGLKETAEILARKLEGIFPGTSCVFLLQEKPGTLSARASVGVNWEYFVGCKTLNASSRSVLVAQEQATYHGEYDRDDLLLTGNPMIAWTSLSSALIVPIVHEGEALGTINLYHPQPNAFRSQDQQLMETIAERSATAIYNGILFDRTSNKALIDPLTNLYNVRYLMEYVDAKCQGNGQQPSEQSTDLSAEPVVLQQKSTPGEKNGTEPAHTGSEPFVVLCLDVDFFKPINENFGHQRGDQVLQELSRILRSVVQESGIISRYGADEFVVLLNGAGPTDGEQMLKKLQDTVEQYDPGLYHSTLGALRLGISVGFACYPEDGLTWETLFSIADRRMYQAKSERKLKKLMGQNHPDEAPADEVAIFP